MGLKKEYKTVPLAEVRTYPGNARRGNLDVIQGSLRELDQYKDILVQKSTGYILAGNNTYLAAHAEGRDSIDIAIIDVDDKVAHKIVLIDNKANDDATYDKDALAKLLESLGGDFTGTGFEQPDLDKLLDSLATTDEKVDVVPPVPVVANTNPGDVWLLGRHRLVCGDATSRDDLSLLMDGELARLIVTSPPYNQGLNNFKASGMQKENPAWVERMADSYNDDRPELDYQAEQVAAMTEWMGFTADDGALFYNHKIRYRDKQVIHPYAAWIIDTPWRLRQEIIWDRQGSITLNARMFMPCDERIYWLTKTADFIFNDEADIKAYSSVWDIAPKVDVPVSAPFPTELPKRCIEAASLRNDIVLDPYGGSGTTLIAAEIMHRRAFVIEMNPAYCDVIITRWETLTGEKATLES